MADTPSRVLAEATDYTGLIEAFRARAGELGITRLEIDDIGGLTSGHASKLLAPIPNKTLGRISLGPLLGALALKLLIVDDADMLPRIVRRIAHRKVTAGRSTRPRQMPAGEIAPRFDFGSEAII